MTDAYSFVVKMCRRKAFYVDAWPPGLMIELARESGIEFKDDRHWGQIFQQLARDGYIRRSGMFPRETSNGSMRPGWIAC